MSGSAVGASDDGGTGGGVSGVPGTVVPAGGFVDGAAGVLAGVVTAGAGGCWVPEGLPPVTLTGSFRFVVFLPTFTPAVMVALPAFLAVTVKAVFPFFLTVAVFLADVFTVSFFTFFAVTFLILTVAFLPALRVRDFLLSFGFLAASAGAGNVIVPAASARASATARVLFAFLCMWVPPCFIWFLEKKGAYAMICTFFVFLCTVPFGTVHLYGGFAILSGVEHSLTKCQGQFVRENLYIL